MALEPIDETEEATVSSETEQMQQEPQEENKRHDNTLACHKLRKKEEDRQVEGLTSAHR